MKTKLVYVFVGGDGGYYYEMLLMSIYSFRIYHPNSQVNVVMDGDTHKWLQLKDSKLLGDVNLIVVPVPDEYDIMQRSRYLKTRLRQIIQGDYLYIDGDTIICKSLKELDKMESDLSMVLNCHKKDDFMSPKVVSLCKAAGMDNVGMWPYYNGGVAFVRNKSVSYQFYEHWHQLWLKSMDNGIPQDQPALCKTNADLGFPVTEMSGVWNCQVAFGGVFNYIINAKIIHYFSANSWGVMKKLLMNRVREKGYVDWFAAILLKHPRFFFAIRSLKIRLIDIYYITKERIAK